MTKNKNAPAAQVRTNRADVVVIGAGPATLGLVCNAIKTNRYHELVTTGEGLAILDQGLSFGGGDLQHFGIHSNTSARGFIKCTYKKKDVDTVAQKSPTKSPAKKAAEDSGSGSDEEMGDDSEREEPGAQSTNNVTTEIIPLNCFRDFYKVAPLYKYIDEFGSYIVPLSLVGMFFNYTGNHILAYTAAVLRKKIFYPQHRVTSIQLLSNGEILTTCHVKTITVKRQMDNSCELVVKAGE